MLTWPRTDTSLITIHEVWKMFCTSSLPAFFAAASSASTSPRESLHPIAPRLSLAWPREWKQPKEETAKRQDKSKTARE